MYNQTNEIAQPTQFGLIKEKIHHQVPKNVEHIQKRFPVSPCMDTKQEQEPIQWETRIEKEQLMRQIKDLVGQVQGMLVGHEEQYVKTEQQDLLRQIREIQTQIQDMTFEKPRQWEKKTEETIRRISEIPTKIQEIIYGDKKQQHKQCQLETPVEFFGECQPVKCEQWGRQVFAEKRRQLIEKMIEQTRILEDVLIEQQYETVYQQMPRMEQLHFHLERELFEQMRKRFVELEEQFFVYGYEQECEQKLRKLFGLLSKQIKQIEEIIYPMAGFEVRMKIHKEQCQQALEKVKGLRGLLQEIVYLTYPEQTCERKHEQETFSYEPLTKFYNLISLPLFYDEEEIFGKQTTRQQETDKIVSLRKELDEIKTAKRDLEMKLYETDKKVEQFKRQIELLEKYPTTKYQTQQPRQVRGEMIQYTKPEEELIKICLKPTQQQQQTYTTVEPKCELNKSRGFMGKYEQQQPISQYQTRQHQQQQQPITKYF